MRISRLTNEHLEHMATEYRGKADNANHLAWPENSEHYRDTQVSTAEVFEELLDRRREGESGKVNTRSGLEKMASV